MGPLAEDLLVLAVLADEPRRSPRSNVVEAQVHVVQRRADLHDRLKLSGISLWPRPGADVLPRGQVHDHSPARMPHRLLADDLERVPLVVREKRI
jgi:hypothetical protein